MSLFLNRGKYFNLFVCMCVCLILADRYILIFKQNDYCCTPFCCRKPFFNYEPTQDSHHPIGQNWADISGSCPFVSTPLTGNGKELRFFYFILLV